MKTTADLVEIINRIPKKATYGDYNQLIAQIVQESEAAKGQPAEQLYQIATMLLYELYPEGAAINLAKRSAELDLIPPIYRKLKAEGWSYNEVFFSKTEAYKTFEETCKTLPENPKPLQQLDAQHPLAKFFTDITGIFVLSEENRVYAYRDKEGYLVLLSYSDTAHEIIADEEEFNDEPPLWFTEVGHFRSPVWAMKKIRRALNNMITHTGMSRIPIRCELIFTASDGCILNIQDVSEDQWGPLNLKLYGQKKKDDPLHALPFESLPMHHLWQYYYSLSESAAFYNPTHIFEEDDDDLDDDLDDDWDDDGLDD